MQCTYHDPTLCSINPLSSMPRPILGHKTPLQYIQNSKNSIFGQNIIWKNWVLYCNFQTQKLSGNDNQIKRILSAESFEKRYLSFSATANFFRQEQKHSNTF